MPHAEVNGIQLDYEESGEGEPIVLVHGSWSTRHSWEPLPNFISDLGRVVRYDRRGHGSSEPAARGSTRRDHEDDLAALIELVADGPAVVVGNSFGGSIALGLAARRPDLVCAAAVHEPPLVSWAPRRPDVLGELGELTREIAAVVALVDCGEHEVAAARFAGLVLGAGGWERLPAEARSVMVGAAPTFAIEQADPLWAALPAEGVEAISCPVLLTSGTESPLWLRAIPVSLARAIDTAELERVPGGGHVPHATHPDAYRRRLAGFMARRNALATA